MSTQRELSTCPRCGAICRACAEPPPPPPPNHPYVIDWRRRARPHSTSLWGRVREAVFGR